MYTQLIPLRIPTGWAVLHNTFVDMAPVIENGHLVNASVFDEDLLWIEQLQMTDDGWRQDPNGLLIDLGWYPAEAPDGSYKLEVFRNARTHHLLTFTSTDRFKITATIERVIQLVLDGLPDTELSCQIDVV